MTRSVPLHLPAAISRAGLHTVTVLADMTRPEVTEPVLYSLADARAAGAHGLASVLDDKAGA